MSIDLFCVSEDSVIDEASPDRTVSSGDRVSPLLLSLLEMILVEVGVGVGLSTPSKLSNKATVFDDNIYPSKVSEVRTKGWDPRRIGLYYI